MTIDFAIIGAQKAGSTFVHEKLRLHPEIFLPKDETQCFEDPFFEKNGLAEIAEYRRLHPDKMVGIKRPELFARSECAARLHHYSKNLQLIVVLRDPIDRLISAYFWYMQVGLIPALEINQGLQKILMEEEHMLKNQDALDLIDYGRYSTHIRRFQKLFEEDQILIVNHRDLRKNPENELVRILSWLNVSTDSIRDKLQLDDKRAPKKSIYSMARLRFLAFAFRSFFYKPGESINERTALEPTSSILKRGLYYGCVVFDRLILSLLFSVEKPKLDHELRAKLNVIYEDEFLFLENIFGRDLPNTKDGFEKNY